MVLVVFNVRTAQHVLFGHILQPEERGGLVFADIAQVIRATATKCHPLGVGIFLDIHFIKSIVRIILDTEYDAPHQFIMFHQFHKAHGVNFLSPPDDLVGPVIVDVLGNMR